MSNNYTYRRLDKDDAAVLLVDHQSGPCNIVGDFSPDEFKNNVMACGFGEVLQAAHDPHHEF